MGSWRDIGRGWRTNEGWPTSAATLNEVPDLIVVWEVFLGTTRPAAADPSRRSPAPPVGRAGTEVDETLVLFDRIDRNAPVPAGQLARHRCRVASGTMKSTRRDAARSHLRSVVCPIHLPLAHRTHRRAHRHGSMSPRRSHLGLTCPTPDRIGVARACPKTTPTARHGSRRLPTLLRSISFQPSRTDQLMVQRIRSPEPDSVGSVRASTRSLCAPRDSKQVAMAVLSAATHRIGFTWRSTA